MFKFIDSRWIEKKFNQDKELDLKINDDLAEEEGINNIRSVNDLGDEDFKLLKTLSVDAGERYVHLKVISCLSLDNKFLEKILCQFFFKNY